MYFRNVTLYLLAFPVGLMGAIQLSFACLSLLIFHDHEERQFFLPAATMIGSALFFVLVSRRVDASRIGFRESLLFAVLTWIICGGLGAIPIVLITHVSITDGVFESVSALTTTGATILSGLDTMPKTFLLYRQFLQWLGGLGVVVFVVAILPMLNVGGMRLLKAETPGPIKDDKLSPRIANTAHYLWFVYLVLTVLCAVGYYLAGMSGFDAVAHSLTTVSTGGFSTHDASMGYFHSPALLIISDLFMLLGAISFSLHFRVWRGRNLKIFWQDEETRWFLLLAAGISVVISTVLYMGHMHDDLAGTLNQSFFHLISFITSTGYGAGDYTGWPPLAITLLIVASYLGGCAGSTAGGNKIIRNILMFKTINLEIKKLIHPRGVFLIKYQGRPVDEPVLSASIAFMAFALFGSMFFSLLLMSTGQDFYSAFTAVSACLNVLGPAFGNMGSNFQPLSDSGTWVLSFAMILGRLEYFTVLALLLPAFWKH
ncbi:MAG: TrkH family potassium uptake protein [Pseudomonadales bacterium]|nr:TrkH family potassium uptake protein [Pseudomonadales bacterium]